MSHNSTIIIDGCEAELTWHGFQCMLFIIYAHR